MSRKRDKVRLLLKKIVFAFFILSSVVSISSVLAYIFIIPQDPLFVNPVIGNKTKNTSTIEELLSKKNIKFSNVSIRYGYYLVDIPDNGEVFIPTKKDLNSQISSLQGIIKQLTIEGKRFRKIDFRFDKPIVVLQEKL